jgi:hypothetical protein
LPKEAAGGGEDLRKSGTCLLLGDPDYRNWDARECTRTSGAPENALLWGDSFAAHYVPGLLANADKLSANIMQYTAAGCPPVLDYYSYTLPRCQEFNRHALEIIKAYNIKSVVLSARWLTLDSRRLAMIQGTVEALRKAHVDVWLIGQSTEFAIDAWVIAYRKGRSPEGADAWPIAFDSAINDRLRRYAEGARFIDPLASLCDRSLCPYSERGELLYSDYGHFSVLGSSRAVEAYFPLFRRAEKAGASRDPPPARP